MELEIFEVRCYSGFTYAERPESFRWGEVEYRVREIVKSWQEPGRRCFDVRTEDNKLYRLCYNEITQKWMVVDLRGGQEDVKRNS